MTSYVVAEQAYVKVILHAAKYPDRSVLGLLVGEPGNDVVRILDAFPLFHQSLTAPAMEAAMMLVRPNN